jgi:hypothetical protein
VLDVSASDGASDGSIDRTLIFEDAAMEQAVKIAAAAAFDNQGDVSRILQTQVSHRVAPGFSIGFPNQVVIGPACMHRHH